MGAQQSSADDPRKDITGGSTKTCYYELLGVERLATDDEIKKAYRRKALELHPDRNINDVETATKKFAEVQAAYDVISDPQERAWYDSHRDTILSGRDCSSEGVEPTTFRNVRLTTTEEILSLIRKFNATILFNDEPTGFFGISRETFEHLALEEEAAADFENIDYPGFPTFGSSNDNYETVVRAFYNAWTGFTTKKSFSWKDKYRLADAPDRRVRRLMEKENKKIRDDAAREFNDAVRFLVSFVRKRDPRYLPNMQTDADRQKSLRDAAAAQAARSRAANREKYNSYEIPAWARSREDDSEQDQFSKSEEESEVEILECVVCNKTFKSDKQLEAHERSKKHVKALQQLRHQMRKEGVDFDLDIVTPDSAGEQAEEHCEDVTTSPSKGRQMESQGGTTPIQTRTTPYNGIPGGSKGTQAERGDSVGGSWEGSDGEEYAPRSVVEIQLSSRVAGESAIEYGPFDGADDLLNTTQGLSIGDSGPQVKVGKAKAKRQKKAALQAMDGEKDHRCSVCGTAFASRTKLFTHIREEDHAAHIPKSGVSVDRKKKR